MHTGKITAAGVHVAPLGVCVAPLGV